MNRESYNQATAFARRIAKFRNSIVEGMTFTVYVYTGDQKIDSKPRLARVVKVYKDWCLLKDDRGIKYGPTYHQLLEWGNV